MRYCAPLELSVDTRSPTGWPCFLCWWLKGLQQSQDMWSPGCRCVASFILNNWTQKSHPFKRWSLSYRFLASIFNLDVIPGYIVVKSWMASDFVLPKNLNRFLQWLMMTWIWLLKTLHLCFVLVCFLTSCIPNPVRLAQKLPFLKGYSNFAKGHVYEAN